MKLEPGRDADPVVAALWREHMEAPFPARLRGEDVNGVDMVMLDADIAGCVVSCSYGAQRPSAEHRDVLRLCMEDLAKVLPDLSEGEARYYERLGRMGETILAAAGS